MTSLPGCLQQKLEVLAALMKEFSVVLLSVSLGGFNPFHTTGREEIMHETIRLKASVQ